MSGTGMTVAEAMALAADRPWAQLSPYHEAARVLAAEVDDLRIKLAATEETLFELSEAWEEAAPMLDAALRDHPSAKPDPDPDVFVPFRGRLNHLRVVPADD